MKMTKNAAPYTQHYYDGLTAASEHLNRTFPTQNNENTDSRENNYLHTERPIQEDIAVSHTHLDCIQITNNNFYEYTSAESNTIRTNLWPC